MEVNPGEIELSPWDKMPAWERAAHMSAVAASFVLLFVWFSGVPALWEYAYAALIAPYSSVARPAERLGSMWGFALVSACVHAFLVGLGLFVGHDATLISKPKTRLGALCGVMSTGFVIQVVALGIGYRLHVIHYSSAFFERDEDLVPFALMSALSLTLTLALACTAPLHAAGLALVRSPLQPTTFACYTR